jgi:hypothetical protein
MTVSSQEKQAKAATKQLFQSISSQIYCHHNYHYRLTTTINTNCNHHRNNHLYNYNLSITTLCDKTLTISIFTPSSLTTITTLQQ